MKNKFDISTNILFNELRDRVIFKGQQIKIDLDKTTNLCAVATFNALEIVVNIFADKYINFPIENGVYKYI